MVWPLPQDHERLVFAPPEPLPGSLGRTAAMVIAIRLMGTRTLSSVPQWGICAATRPRSGPCLLVKDEFEIPGMPGTNLVQGEIMLEIRRNTEAALPYSWPNSVRTV